MKTRGFTLIEMMIVISIIGIVLAITFNAVNGDSNKVQFGVNGMSETRCINGYTFIVGRNGSVQQMLNAQGGGVQCN